MMAPKDSHEDLKLMIDARYVRPVHDGISRYTSSLLHALYRGVTDGSLPGVRVAMLISDDEQLAQLPDLPHVRGFSPTGPLEPLSALAINRYRPDVLFSPMQTIGSWGRNYGLILTLHDLIYYDHPEAPGFLPAPVRWGWRQFHRTYVPQRILLNRADDVATVSHTTAGLIARHRLTRRPVHVIPNAPPEGSIIDRSTALARIPGRGKSLVYMGSAMPYKGVDLLIRSMTDLPDYELHLLSRFDPRRREELERMVPDGARVVFHDGVSDEEYRHLLATCTALVSASSAEGYGLPVAEAAAEGAPRILSDIPIFREVAPGAVHLNFRRSGALRQAVRDLEEPGEFKRQVLSALRDAERDSWETSARALVSLAHTVRGRRGRSARFSPPSTAGGPVRERPGRRT